MRFHLGDVARHTVAFQLEEPCGMTLADKLKGFRVVERNVIQIQVNLMTLFDHLACSVHHGQCGKPKKVDLEQPQFGDDIHLKLCNGFNGRLFSITGRSVKRKIF